MDGLRGSGAKRAASIGEETLGTVGGAGGVDDARRILAMYAGLTPPRTPPRNTDRRSVRARHGIATNMEPSPSRSEHQPSTRLSS